MIVNTSDHVAQQRSTDYGVYLENSLIGHMLRGGSAGVIKCKENQLQLPPGTYALPIIQFTGVIEVVNQFAVITEVVTLTNCTDLYSTAYDGTVSKNLNRGNPGGAVISGFPVGSFGSKTGGVADPFTVLSAAEVQAFEPGTRDIGFPFTLVAKTGVDNFLRVHLTTTDNPLDFTLLFCFEYRTITEGSDLVFL